jgi:hypothetical protein
MVHPERDQTRKTQRRVLSGSILLNNWLNVHAAAVLESGDFRVEKQVLREHRGNDAGVRASLRRRNGVGHFFLKANRPSCRTGTSKWRSENFRSKGDVRGMASALNGLGDVAKRNRELGIADWAADGSAGRLTYLIVGQIRASASEETGRERVNIVLDCGGARDDR